MPSSTSPRARRLGRRAGAAGGYTTSTRGRTLAEEGFIHAVRADQWQGVRERYYADVDEPLVLLDDRHRPADVAVARGPGRRRHLPAHLRPARARTPWWRCSRWTSAASLDVSRSADLPRGDVPQRLLAHRPAGAVIGALVGRSSTRVGRRRRRTRAAGGVHPLGSAPTPPAVTTSSAVPQLKRHAGAAVAVAVHDGRRPARAAPPAGRAAGRPCAGAPGAPAQLGHQPRARARISAAVSGDGVRLQSPSIVGAADDDVVRARDDVRRRVRPTPATTAPVRTARRPRPGRAPASPSRSAASSRAPRPEQFTTTSGPDGSAERLSRVIVPPSSSTRPASQRQVDAASRPPAR